LARNAEAVGAQQVAVLRGGIARRGGGGTVARRVRLFAAIRPFQVNPPWQAWGELGGTRQIARIAWDGHAVVVDGSRAIEVYSIAGNGHNDAFAMIYLPKEKILAYADMFNLPTAAAPVPNPPVIGTMVFMDNIERLKLEPEKLLSVHTLNPDRLATRADILASLGRK